MPNGTARVNSIVIYTNLNNGTYDISNFTSVFRLFLSRSNDDLCLERNYAYF